MANLKQKMKSHDTVTRGSGNVFADLGLGSAEQLLAKAQLVDVIAETIRKRRLKQADAAAIIGIPQPKVSALLQGDTRGFSYERLMRIIAALGRDVRISIGRQKKCPGRVCVSLAVPIRF